MKQALNQLSKNLARGMSRRRAFWQFITSLGVVGELTGRKAMADGGCGDFCQQQAQMFQTMCIALSQTCSSRTAGTCAEISINGSLSINATRFPATIVAMCVPVHEGS